MYLHKPSLPTAILIAINVFFALLLVPVSFNSLVLAKWGASFGAAPTVQVLGDFPPFNLLPSTLAVTHISLTGTVLIIWRAVYASFLHFSLIHLLSNMYALWLFGDLLSALSGSFSTLSVYFVTGAFSMYMAGIVNPNSLTAGASGAIFGIMGALLGLFLRVLLKARHANSYAIQQILYTYQQAGSTVIFALVQNLIVTFTTPGISVPGHVFGLLAGLVMSLILPWA